jgi:hypothetical protein
MSGNIISQMTHGIDESVCVLVFITENFVVKTRGEAKGGENDNCKLEFEYAMTQKGVGQMVPVVMEARVSDPKTWRGALGMALGQTLCKINFGHFPKSDEARFTQEVRNMMEELLERCRRHALLNDTAGDARDAAASHRLASHAHLVTKSTRRMH